MKFLKKPFLYYQELMWYASLAKSEYAKIGSFIPETVAITTLLAVKGYDIKFWQIPLFYIGLMIGATLAGKFLATIGIAKFNTTLGNTHNMELQEILKLLREKK